MFADGSMLLAACLLILWAVSGDSGRAVAQVADDVPVQGDGQSSIGDGAGVGEQSMAADAQPLPETPSHDLVPTREPPKPPLPQTCFIDEQFDPYWSPGEGDYASSEELLQAVWKETVLLEREPTVIPRGPSQESELTRTRMKETARRRALEHAVLVDSGPDFARWSVTLEGRLSAEFIAHHYDDAGWVLDSSWFQVPMSVCILDAKGF